MVAVVDLEKVTPTALPARQRKTALAGQVTALQVARSGSCCSAQDRRQSLQTAVNALKGKEPDAALQARIKAFQTKQQ